MKMKAWTGPDSAPCGSPIPACLLPVSSGGPPGVSVPIAYSPFARTSARSSGSMSGKSPPRAAKMAVNRSMIFCSTEGSGSSSSPFSYCFSVFSRNLNAFLTAWSCLPFPKSLKIWPQFTVATWCTGSGGKIAAMSSVISPAGQSAATPVSSREVSRGDPDSRSDPHAASIERGKASAKKKRRLVRMCCLLVGGRPSGGLGPGRFGV